MKPKGKWKWVGEGYPVDSKGKRTDDPSKVTGWVADPEPFRRAPRPGDPIPVEDRPSIPVPPEERNGHGEGG